MVLQIEKVKIIFNKHLLPFLLMNRFTLHDCQHADFSNAQDKIIGTSEQTAKVS